MGTYTKKEFAKGCLDLGCDDLNKWKAFISGRAKQEIGN